MKTVIAYYRVSTDRQCKSGLGLEAQQEAVHLFADREGYLVTHYTEIESGKKNQRPLSTPANSSAIAPIPAADRLDGYAANSSENPASALFQPSRGTIHRIG